MLGRVPATLSPSSMDRLNAIIAFVRVVEAGSFAAAARRLSLSVSNVSRHVAGLENHLGVRLLNRTTRRLSLTATGRAFFDRSVQLLADLEEAESEAATAVEPRGTLRLTCATAFGVRHVAPAIAAYRARHPRVHFDVELSDRIVDLVEEGFDLAIRMGEVRGGALVARRLGESSMVCCAAPAYLERHGTPRAPADLAHHQCLTYAYSQSADTWRFRDEHGHEHAVKVQGPAHANHGEMLCALSVAGLGVHLEPDVVVAPDVRAGRLVVLLPGYGAPSVPIHAVYASRQHLSAKVRSFIDFVAARFAADPSWRL
jgi:DNA-binding transcriptional LysR family regulator